MKKLISVCAAIACALAMICAAGAANSAAVSWAYTENTPVISAAGTYPRLAKLSDGRLLATHGTCVSFSADHGDSWTTTRPLPTPQKTAMSASHRLNPANHQPFVLPGKGQNGADLVLIAYRCDTNGFGNATVGTFYTSLRVVTIRP